MDTSAVVRKATTDAEKKKHMSEGWCFRCSKQGHVAQNCPDWPAQVRATTEDSPEVLPKVESIPTGGAALAEFCKKLSEDEVDIFVKTMQEDGIDMGFQDA